MPRGASPKREREYEELKEKFEDEGRYKGREEEVAARIVNKQRAEQGETNAAHEEDRKGQSPDRDLPVKNYDGLTIEEVTSRLAKLQHKDVEKLRDYEKAHRGRKTLLEEFDRHLDKS
ncbi:hypothetical protein IAD21_06102 [Abditibacteriota bacterium]|nr:hypothetical protein IAD21_06102 [Abditibacteriota bacterium]